MATPRHEQLFALFIAVWGGIFTWSIIGLATNQAGGEGFTRGLDRVTAFLLWQLVAGGLSIPVYFVGRGYDRGSWLRWVSRMPLVLAVTFVLAIVAVMVWARFAVG